MDRYYQAQLQVPAGTLASAPVSQAVPLEDAELIDIELYVPIGHAGLTGIRASSSHQQILPWGNAGWITVDNYFRVFEFNDQVGANAISIQGYNTDVIAHTFWLRFHIRTLPATDQGTLSSLIGTGLGSLTSDNIGALAGSSSGGVLPGIGLPPTPTLPGFGITLPGGMPVTSSLHGRQQFMLLNW